MSVDTAARPGLEPASDPRAGGLTTARRVTRGIWRSGWPKLLAVLIFFGIWHAVVLTGWKPEYLLPGPVTVGQRLVDLLGEQKFWDSISRTLGRAAIGFAMAMAIGTALGIAVSRSRLLRAGIGSLITGLQTMPSVVWFPLAILLIGLNEQAITFVVVLGAAPSIANGIISGIDHVPPAFTRLGTVLGARGLTLYRYVVIPAALPAYVAGLNQGWAFAWRSLMAGELLVVIPGTQTIGTRLQFARELSDAEGVIATMIVILVIGILVDSLVFSRLERRVLRKRGLGVTA